MNRFVTYFSSFAVLIAIIAGLYFSGSPGEQRKIRIDEQRIQDLTRISRAISAYSEQHNRLPADTSEIVDGQRMRSLPTDPETGSAYGYEKLDTYIYRLCAVFSTASIKRNSGDFWAHEPGMQCFKFETNPGG